MAISRPFVFFWTQESISILLELNRLSFRVGPNHADCKTQYKPVHFLIIERDLSSSAEALSAFTLREGRCTGAGA
jgi:hypothetical protein